jgi:hypothetical protein
MKYNISKIWTASLELMAKNPIVVLPFMIIAFFESIALELIYFSTRPPISALADPIIRKFFGEPFVHYPGNLLILTKLFYYAQVVLYISISVALLAASVNMFKNIKEGLPVRLDAMLKNSVKRYFEYFGYGCIIIILLFISNKAETFLFSKIMLRMGNLLPQSVMSIFPIGMMLIIFITNVIIYTLLISTVPLMVIEKRPLLKSCGLSIYVSVRNFSKIFPLVLLPFAVYMPFTLLKSFPGQLADKLFPEINLYITFLSIVVTIFVDCFMILCVSQWLIDNRKESRPVK